MKSCWNLKLGSLLILVVLFVKSAVAQFGNSEAKFTSEEKFLFPIKPGKPGSLAGTMGELRTTHFHSGIDIRTNNEMGWPVLASKSGYISKAAVTPSGYGNVLYINHPDGTTTLYGHLDRFLGPAGDYILKERYNSKTSIVELTFAEGQFPVEQGDTIAYAGNTGSSDGPHLHFNIQKGSIALDPLKFQFDEIKDIIPPVIQKIALITLDANSRINDQFGRFEFYVARIGNAYSLPAPILAYGNIGVELLGFDRLENIHFRCGINYIEMFVDDKKVFDQQIEEVNTSESRSIYSLMDYKTLRSNGNKFYKLYVDDGNSLDFYKSSPTNGKIKVNPNDLSTVKIKAKDIFGNTSEVTLKLKPSTPTKEVHFLEPAKKNISYDYQQNTLAITAQSCKRPALYYKNGTTLEMEPAYFNTGKSVYLFDLRSTIPDSINVCNQTLIPNIKAIVPSGIEYKYYSDRADVQFGAAALFDTLYLNASHQFTPGGAEVFTIGNSLVALNKSILVTLKPVVVYSTNPQVSVYRMVGKGLIYEGGKWVNGNMQFYARELGKFTIATDSIPPTVKPVYITNQSVRFKVRDNLSGVGTFEASVNGKWLLMNFDAKTATLTSERLNKKEIFKGEFLLTVTDNAGNKTVFKQKIL